MSALSASSGNAQLKLDGNRQKARADYRANPQHGHWITSAKQSETRTRRIKNACLMLASGKRRPCCFDRSSFYSKSMRAPKAAS